MLQHHGLHRKLKIVWRYEIGLEENIYGVLRMLILLVIKTFAISATVCAGMPKGVIFIALLVLRIPHRFGDSLELLALVNPLTPYLLLLTYLLLINISLFLLSPSILLSNQDPSGTFCITNAKLSPLNFFACV